MALETSKVLTGTPVVAIMPPVAVNSPVVISGQLCPMLKQIVAAQAVVRETAIARLKSMKCNYRKMAALLREQQMKLRLRRG